MAKDKKLILLAGGGSGGHIYPLVAVCEGLKKLAFKAGFDLEFHYLGRVDVFSAVLFDVQGVQMHSLWVAKLRRYFSLANIFDLPKFFLSIFQALWKVYWIMPDVIFSKGGSGALPVVLAGWFYRIPILIHESDAAPGVTNILSAKFAKKVAVGFERATNYFDSRKVSWTGNPIRGDLLGERYLQSAAKEELGFKGGEFLTLILGGSQGSKRINEFILGNLEKITKETQVLHQTGAENFFEVKKLSRAAMFGVSLKEELEHRYHPIPYLNKELKGAFIAADLVVARAGGGTIFEIAAFGKPAILIPLDESANDHQRVNALEFTKAGGGIIIEEENLLSGIFLGQLKEILGNHSLLEKMSSASAGFLKPDAAEKIAVEIFSLLGFES
ncbi:MAG: UDP-N-acetylglucosamine--N-acetylmuramyl-(pentapeptide) pyrophosphoryl-undecaprenol N-acetylglucosamine transferase [Patescibacteria group bacterium]